MSIFGAASSPYLGWEMWWGALFFGVLISFTGSAFGAYARVIGKEFLGSIGFYMNLVGYPILFFVTFPF
jgi:hypothetical protein